MYAAELCRNESLAQKMIQLLNGISCPAEKLRLQEDLFRLRSQRREAEVKRDHLVNKAKVLQARATRHKAKVGEGGGGGAASRCSTVVYAAIFCKEVFPRHPLFCWLKQSLLCIIPILHGSLSLSLTLTLSLCPRPSCLKCRPVDMKPLMSLLM